MPYLQLSVDLGSRDAEEIEAACFEAGALSVTLSDAQDQPILEPAPGATPLWSHTRLSALFPIDAYPEDIAAIVGEDCSFTRVEDRQWEREWLKDFRPMRFGQRLWVCPHGQPPADENAIVVSLDPGLAFGTGTHPTTAMCLEWLEAAELKDKTLIDYGCGSGILAIAALKLGARAALGIDLDPQALLATRDNAERNGVSDRLTVLPPSVEPRPADIVVANILASPLIELVPTFAALMNRGGRIALCGILGEQSSAVTEAYAPWFDMVRFAIRTGTSHESWVCLHGVRR